MRIVGWYLKDNYSNDDVVGWDGIGWEGVEPVVVVCRRGNVGTTHETPHGSTTCTSGKTTRHILENRGREHQREG